MNYISIIPFAILLLAVTSTQTFNGTRVYLNKTAVEFMADESAKELIEKVKDISFGKIITPQKIFFLNFDITIENIKTNFTSSAPKGNGEFKAGKLTMIYESFFDLNINFTMSARIQNALVANGPGKVKVSGKKLNLTVDYTRDVNISKAEFGIEVGPVEFNGGVLGDSLVDIARKKFGDEIGKKLKVIEDNYIPNDPLSALETPKILENKANISISRVKLNTNGTEDNLTRFVDSEVIYGEKRKVLNKSCITDSQSNFTTICYCPHMFLEMLIIAGVEETVDMTSWNSKGKVIELYEILPSLINYYSPDIGYTVTRKAIEPPKPSSKDEYELAKLYIFKIGDDTVLSMTTTFNTTMLGKVENEKLFVRCDNTTITSITTQEIIQPSGRTVLARLMLAEAKNIKEKPMFTEGIEIIGARNQTTALSGTSNTNLCIELLTKP